MLKRLTPRLIIIILAIAIAGILLYPTIQHEMLSPEERQELREQGKLAELESKIIRRGLDLQGGIHLVLEVDVPTLVNNIARNKSQLFEEVFQQAQSRLNEETTFLNEFLEVANQKELRLVRYFPDRGIQNEEIISSLQEEATDAVRRALEIIRNRVDQFGVSEPTIQKVGNRRIIVELAGIQDPARARELIQTTALLEFKLLKTPEVTNATIQKIDRVLRRRQGDVAEALGAQDTAETDTTIEEGGVAEDEAVSVDELFGGMEDETATDTSEDSTVVVDRQVFEEKPFTALLRNVQGQIGVPQKNRNAVNRILKMEAVQEVIPPDAEFLWSAGPEVLPTQAGGADEFHLLYLVNEEAGLTGGVVTDAQATLGGSGGQAAGQPVVYLDMNAQGSKTWSRLTGANIGRRVAIVLDDKVHMAPNIRSKISQGSTMIEGMANLEEAKDIAIVLRAGALPAPVDIIEERTVGPSLGSDSIQKGTTATLIGLLLVLVFMALYYKLSGFIADFALVLNLIFILAILAALGATLTLPGIAGLILTVGLSVDANVLIFDRIREELRKGKTVRAAIDSGYGNALRTIIDANVTTILAALVLMQFGTGPIKGFAVVLFWGIVSSMFTAIFVTRTIYQMFTENKTVKKLSI
ncbi:MAG: protein translocase subunit SecD [Candidatus Marinimicrobia bacterium]|nr:protein translocase subunit SecD [Candidatus Neomarinimicrobiota bacterium]MCF7829883.1 protein translocase subunit SecD [Candidatus Neomarinimicrobiota bacterium]MCF7879154.1 protein translocase subunit SecD [Candidatus Neomarinimicrobiota bacterium]